MINLAGIDVLSSALAIIIAAIIARSTSISVLTQQRKAEAEEAKATLLRAKYEEMFLHFVHSLDWHPAFEQATSYREARVCAAEYHEATIASVLARLYFPEFRALMDQHVQAQRDYADLCMDIAGDRYEDAPWSKATIVDLTL